MEAFPKKTLLAHADLQERFENELRNYRQTSWKRLHLGHLGLTEVPSEVLELTELRSVDLSNNKLETIPQGLLDLPNLQSLSLIGNPLAFIPNRVENLLASEQNRVVLQIDGATYRRCNGEFDMSNVDLVIDANVSEEDADFLIKNAKYLKFLRVGQLSITIGAAHPAPEGPIQRVLDSLAKFECLESLVLSGMRLEVVPESISTLSHLKYLDLDALGLVALPYWIGTLNIERFAAIDNQLSSLPVSFRNLTRLRSLDISWNPFNCIPEEVYELASLEHLEMEKCGILEVPADILRLHRLKRFEFEQNPVESPPAEVAKEGLEAIRDYWRQRADAGVDYLCEAKLIILGEAGAGKTSLAHKIENPDFKLREQEKSTEGIDVIRYEFPTAIRTRENGKEQILRRNFQVNIWDFGGQEIYHATHQFFLTRRSVYVLVCDDRKEDTDFSYWLQVVQMLSDASPLLIVQNEKQDRTRDINLSSLRAQFGNLREAIATNLNTNRGLDRVIQVIRRELEMLPHVGVGLPATWKRVREALEQDQRDFISLDQYLSICQQHGFTRREDKLQLSGYLHDLGICLHFQDDALLKNTVVLKPAWGTDAVYRVLDDPEVLSARGRFTRAHLRRIWSEEKYAGMQDELLRLMMKFQLCYALESDQDFIAPQLLSSDQPSYPWEQAGGLVVRYEYEFLPKGMLTRFIVAMHRLIAGGKLVWKTGVVLERDGARAEIVEDYSQRRIRVRVSGAAPYGLLAIVDEQLERLHTSFPRLKYERFLPCSCGECRGKAEPYGFALEKLIRRARKSQPIQCHASGEMIDAERLVRDILPAALRGEYNVDASFSGAALQVPVSAPTPEVFVSYAWNTESCAVVDHLQKVLGEHGIRLIRDREEVRYKDSIRDFMRNIGQGKCVVVVISEKYLKSENCMFEMVEMVKAQALRERIFPIVLPDANIYKATGRIGYVQHWESETKTLDKALKTVRGDNLKNLQEDLNIYTEIRRLFDEIANTLRDMNALTPDQHQDSDFNDLVVRIRAQLGS